MKISNLYEKGLRNGLIGESYLTVTSQETAVKVGSGALEVLSTPVMIAQMEAAAVSAIDPYLPDGYASVGVEIKIEHLSATPIGEYLTAMAEITRINDNRITLEVRAWDEHNMVGSGTHIRYIIHADEFMSGLRGETAY